MIEEKFAYIKAKEIMLATLELGVILEKSRGLETEHREKIEEINLRLTEIFMDDYMGLQPTYEPGEHSFRTGLRWDDEHQ